MPALEKILGALINASRAAYVRAAELSAGSTDIRKALLKAIVNSRMLAPRPTNPLLKGKVDLDTIMKIVQGMNKTGIK
jgi:hypothetical protein